MADPFAAPAPDGEQAGEAAGEGAGSVPPPPTYESVVMSQQIEVPVATTGGQAGAGGPEGALEVKVSDPVEQGKGMGAYVSYRVQTTTSLPQYQKGEMEVIRRFRDFSWLHDRLVDRYKGIVVPPLPEKDVVQKFQMNMEFIEKRCRALNVFINRVCQHPQLRLSQDLQLFLEATESVWQFEVARATGGGGGMLHKTMSAARRALKDLQMSTSNLVTGKSISEEEDGEYLEVKKYFIALESSVNEIYRQSTRVVERQLKLGMSVSDFGRAMRDLGEAEEEESSGLKENFLHMADCAEAQGDKLKEFAAELDEKTVEPMKEAARYMYSVKTVLNDRASSLTAWHQRRSEVDGRKARLQRLKTTPGIPDSKVSDAEQELNLAERKAEAAKELYHSIKERMVSELRNFQVTRAADLHKILLEFAEHQKRASEEQLAAWKELAPKLAT